MPDIRSYRDTPKPGETDAKWCAYEVVDGHVRRQTGNHETEAEARAALGETHARKRAKAARYEHSTQTIRSVPENYWLATMNSWDGAIDHGYHALLFTAAPAMRDALELIRKHAAQAALQPEFAKDHCREIGEIVAGLYTSHGALAS